MQLYCILIALTFAITLPASGAHMVGYITLQSVAKCNQSNCLSCISKRYLKRYRESREALVMSSRTNSAVCYRRRVGPWGTSDDGSPPYSTINDRQVMNLLLPYCFHFCLRRRTQSLKPPSPQNVCANSLCV